MRTIKKMYCNQRGKIRLNNDIGEHQDTRQGVRQRSPISREIFLVCEKNGSIKNLKRFKLGGCNIYIMKYGHGRPDSIMWNSKWMALIQTTGCGRTSNRLPARGQHTISCATFVSLIELIMPCLAGWSPWLEAQSVTCYFLLLMIKVLCLVFLEALFPCPGLVGS